MSASSSDVPKTLEVFLPWIRAQSQRGAVRVNLNAPATAPAAASTSSSTSASLLEVPSQRQQREVLSKSTGDAWSCVLCGDEKPSIARIARACQCEPSPCNGHQCECHRIADLHLQFAHKLQIDDGKTPEATPVDSNKTHTDDSSAPTAAEPEPAVPPSLPTPDADIHKDIPVYRACADCVFRQLWAETSSSLRSLGQFRAKCAFCKAYYCHHDIVLLKWPDDNAASTASKQKQGGSRGRGGGRGKQRGSGRGKTT